MKTIMVGDFETTAFDGQAYTEVWASAVVALNTEDVHIFNSIDATFDYLGSLLKKQDIILYYHNLKFDGSFILDWLMKNPKFSPNYVIPDNGSIYDVITFHTKKEMNNNEYKYLISNMGAWYSIILKWHGHFLEIRDSLKLIPASVKAIGESFKTRHKKLEIEYKGVRHAGGIISPEEQAYIANDVLVVKEALELMYEEGHTKLTIGSCCMNEFKTLKGRSDFNSCYVDLTKRQLNRDIYGSDSAEEYIRKSYRGGWCYLAKGKENRIFTDGITLDVNSLYPSVMHSVSGNVYPYGDPCFWHGDFIPDMALGKNRYYFIRIRTRFKLRTGFLPTIQIKNSVLYKKNEYLESSDIIIKGKHYNTARSGDTAFNDRVTLTLTCTDYDLIRKHYILYDTEILDGCWFFAYCGQFDDYINKYRDIKMTAKGARRQCAKLFLNNLYGKFATSANSSYKIGYLEDERIRFATIPDFSQKTVYIPIGSAVTSYARAFTITAAQQNYYGADKPGFIYADTDSIHCDIPIGSVKGVEQHDSEFLKWKCERNWQKGLFVRQKTYIEQERKHFYVTAAGMGKRAQELLEANLSREYIETKTDQEKNFMEKPLDLQDFRTGLTVPGNLKQHRIPGGVILVDEEYVLQ